MLLRWAIIFLVVAVLAALFGFGGLATGAEAIARVLFYVFLLLFVLGLAVHLVQRAA